MRHLTKPSASQRKGKSGMGSVIDAEEILKRHTEAYAKCEVKYNMTGPAILLAIQEYADLQQSANLAKIKELEETVKDRESHATFLQEKRNELQTECDNRLANIKELEAEIESLRIIANDVATFSSNNVTTIDLKRKAQFYFKQYPLKPQEK